MAEKYNWIHLLAYVMGLVNQELLRRNEYLVAENRILKAQIKGRLSPSDGECSTLAEIPKRLGHKALEEIACVAKADTILAWYRRIFGPPAISRFVTDWIGPSCMNTLIRQAARAQSGRSSRK
jgi:hypothetical protein